MTSFSNAGCTPSNDTSLATDNAVSTIDELKTAANANLSAAIAVANEINSYSFDKAQFPPDFDGSGQLPDQPLSDKPDLDELLFNAPDDPGDVIHNEITGASTETYLPVLDTTLVDKLIDTLCDILDNGYSGLPPVYECLRWEQARSEAQRETWTAKQEAITRFSAMGWSSPQGPELAVCDTADHDESIKLAAASRDIAMKIYDTAIDIMMQALSATAEYFDTWASLYDTWADSQTKLSENQLTYARQQLSQLGEKIKIFRIQSDNERDRVSSLANAYSSNIDVYRSQIQLGDHTTRRNQSEFSLETIRRELTAMENQQHNRSNAAGTRRDIMQDLSRLREQFGMYGKAVAAQMQAMSFQSTMSSRVSSGNRKSCSTDYSYSERKTL